MGIKELLSLRPRDAMVVDETEWNDALDFWQKEVHYYESRAGEQGASANRVITLAAGAAALVPVVGQALTKPVLLDQIDVRVALYVVPAVILLLWATAIRLLHEMEILREYRYHAERQLSRFALADARLGTYRPWEGIGSKYDAPQPVMLVIFGLTASISLVGVLGVLWGMHTIISPVIGWWALVPWLIGVIITGALAMAFRRNNLDAAAVAAKLGNPPRGKR